MSEAAAKPGMSISGAEENGGNQILFWGCFIALVTTAFGFIARIFLVGTWAGEFGLDKAESGRLLGVGIWPFAVSIIGFSLVIDRIGYKVSMLIAFGGHLLWAIMGYAAYAMSHDADGKVVADPNAKATAYSLLYWGSLILALANGTVEAFINPVVATVFSKEKTKWLNILHAGWPGGLVFAGMATIFIDHLPWGIKVGILAVPALIYCIMLISQKFPVQEREAAGVSYKDMLSEFGVLSALVVGFLVPLQLMEFFSSVDALCVDGKSANGLLPAAKIGFWSIGVAFVLGFGVYTMAAGRILMFVLVLIMMPLATTEIGTDGFIADIMKDAVTFHPGWILVYTAAIMMVLRFFAGPIVHAFSPLGLLAASAALAIGGLYLLSGASGFAMILVAATLYGFGKTFFWPTMLGVVSEQTPKGGALTLNAISGIGMLAVGMLGTPFIGKLLEARQIQAVAETPEAKKVPGLLEGSTLSASVLADKTMYEVIPYKVISDAKLADAVKKAPADEQEAVTKAFVESRKKSSQWALADMALFPAIMLAGYIALILYFQSRGGYKPVELAAGGGGGDKAVH